MHTHVSRAARVGGAGHSVQVTLPDLLLSNGAWCQKKSAIYDRLAAKGAYFKDVSGWEGADWYAPASHLHARFATLSPGTRLQAKRPRWSSCVELLPFILAAGDFAFKLRALLPLRATALTARCIAETAMQPRGPIFALGAGKVALNCVHPPVAGFVLV